MVYGKVITSRQQVSLTLRRSVVAVVLANETKDELFRRIYGLDSVFHNDRSLRRVVYMESY